MGGTQKTDTKEEKVQCETRTNVASVASFDRQEWNCPPASCAAMSGSFATFMIAFDALSLIEVDTN